MLSVKSRRIMSQPIVGAMLLVSIITALPTPSFAQQKPSAISGVLDTNYTLGGGDRIKVNVYEVPDYTGEYQIPPGGAINLPLIGKVSLLGLTTEEAADRIEKEYQVYLKRPIISVNLLSPRPINIFVAGEVTRPGSYSLSLQGGAGQDPGVQYKVLL
jgi:polysaccharide biosynthesis/export protein